MAASATPWSKSTVSQPVTLAEPIEEVPRFEAPNEPDDFAGRQRGSIVSPVVQLVAWIGLGVAGVLIVVLLQHCSWSNSPAGGTGSGRRTSDSAPQATGGIAVGAVADNDGSTLRVRAPVGGTTTVHTDAQTSVHVFPGSKVADVGRGSMVVVYGRKEADGSIDASLIMGLSMPR